MIAKRNLTLDLSRALPYLPLVLLLAWPALCQYDFSKSTSWYYDFLSMNNNILWLLFMIVSATALAGWKKGDIPLPCLVAIVAVFSVAEVWSNYPMIWRDVFFHGSSVRAIVGQGYVGGTWLKYPDTNPGFFLLWSIVQLVTGSQTFEANLLMLLPVGVIVLMIGLVALYRKLPISIPNTTALFTFLLLNFNKNEFMFLHFNTRLLSLIYVLLIVSLFVKQGNDPMRSISLVILNAALVISHALNSLVPAVFFGMYWMSNRKRIDSGWTTFVSCATIYVAWNVYVGYEVLKAGLTTFLTYAYLKLAADLVAGWFQVGGNPGGFVGSALATYYKLLLITLGLISLYCAIKLRGERKVSLLRSYLFSTFAVYGLSFLSVLNWISIDRGIMLASIAIASLPMILFTLRTRNSLASWRRRTLVVAIIVLIMPQFLLVHEPAMASSGAVASIERTCVFLLDYRNGRGLASLNTFPIYYSFYDPFYSGYENLEYADMASLKNVTNFLLTRPKGTLRVVDYRDTVDWGSQLRLAGSYREALTQWDREVYAKVNLRCNIVYSSGFERVYG